MANLVTSVSQGALLPITGESKDRHDHHVGLGEANIEKKNCNVREHRTWNKDRSKIVIIVILAARCSREEQSELGRS